MRKLPIDQQMNRVEMFADDVTAFEFKFNEDTEFPAETKTLRIPVKKSGCCYGIIQWIYLRLYGEIIFENHPIKQQSASAWFPMFYRFEQPVELSRDQVVYVLAMHNRQSPYFKLETVKSF